MPKIEVNQKKLFSLIGKKYTNEELEDLLVAAKAELDDVNDQEGIFKIELNDTNRPDLWSTAGLARQIKVYTTKNIPNYSFPKVDVIDDSVKEVIVDPQLKDIRPYIVAFNVTGPPIDEPALKDIIQTQEKLCWNFGRKRSSIAMGVYRSENLQFPIRFIAADPDTTKYVPLQMDKELTLREILKEHPKGHEFGHIIADFPKYPFLIDSTDQVLSMPPIINSAEVGAVKVGDTSVFVELTGTDLSSLILAGNIVACDLIDLGYSIEPLKIKFPYDTPYGRQIMTPSLFQEPVSVAIEKVTKMLGTGITLKEAQEALLKMGIDSKPSFLDSNEKYSSDQKQEVTGISIKVPEYRNDFLHPVDIIEDIIIGKGMDAFEPIMPSDLTVGRLSPSEEFGRDVKEIMIGLGYQEMVYNYLGSKRDFIDRMAISGNKHIQVANPMTENYEYVRASILPSLLNSESVSAHAVYPHHIFEVGKVAFLEASDNSGTTTRNYVGFLSADRDTDFTLINSHVSALMFYLNIDYTVVEKEDLRFITGRCAEIIVNDNRVGVFGEFHPQVLENWGIQVPCVAAEVDLDVLSNNN